MTRDDYSGLRALLQSEHEWPYVYTFKFVCKPEQQSELEAATGLSGFNVRASSKGRYISLTLKQEVPTPDAVIDIYIAAQSIEGVMVI